jgi:hypothetical protein
MHHYGEEILASLPQGALLMSHTDLNWNSIRYLQTCEGMRLDVVHITFQLIPYPWFQRQQPLYEAVHFPKIFAGVSTNKMSDANARLVVEFIYANAPNFEHIFLDAQAINEKHLGKGNMYYGLALQQWGVLYRVVPGVKNWRMTANFHHASYKSLPALTSLTLSDFLPGEKYGVGSWEHAALSVRFDAYYQLSLAMLSFAIDVKEDPHAEDPRMILERLHLAASLLRSVLFAVETYQSLSSPFDDVYKNAALAWMKYQGIGEPALALHS